MLRSSGGSHAPFFRWSHAPFFRWKSCSVLLVEFMLRSSGGSHAPFFRWKSCSVLLVEFMLRSSGGSHAPFFWWKSCSVLEVFFFTYILNHSINSENCNVIMSISTHLFEDILWIISRSVKIFAWFWGLGPKSRLILIYQLQQKIKINQYMTKLCFLLFW